MSELKQQRYELTVIVKKKKPTIKSIHTKLMEKQFTSAQLILQILINNMIQDEEKYNLVMSKATSIIFKLISNQH